MRNAIEQRLRLSTGGELAYRIAGDPANPALLLLHGFPSSSRTFRDLIPRLSGSLYLLAPDLPGFGQSDLPPRATFDALGEAILELLDRLRIGPRYVYLHDFGAPVGLHVAMHDPDSVLGLILQNANAHETGFGEAWGPTRAFWRDPTPENEAGATTHLTAEGTRDQYVAGVPEDVTARIARENWEKDWKVMQLPGRLAMHRSLIRDYGRYAERFRAIAAYLRNRQPPALMLWGRHDAFFDLRETVSWMEDLPRMEAHILDGGHFLLETHAETAARLILEFVRGRAAGDRPNG